MPKKDPRVDAYIARAQPFAQPILIHIRKVVHAAVPEVQETMKWSSPHFDYKGIFCGWRRSRPTSDSDSDRFDEGPPARQRPLCGRTVRQIPTIRICPRSGNWRASSSLRSSSTTTRSPPPMRARGPLKAPPDLLAARRRTRQRRRSTPRAARREYGSWVEARQPATRDAHQDRGRVDGRRKIRNWKYVPQKGQEAW
jgi:hypothetical protein